MSRPGRPAGPATETERTVLTAALGLLLDEGVAALTAQRLHQATGVSRSTVYRHWPTPATVLAALVDVASESPGPSTGDAVADMHAEVDRLCDRLRDKPVGVLLQALLTAAASDPESAALRDRYVDGLTGPFTTALRRAGLSRTQRSDAMTAVVSPLLLDAVLGDRPVARARAHRVLDQVR